MCVWVCGCVCVCVCQDSANQPTNPWIVLKNHACLGLHRDYLGLSRIHRLLSSTFPRRRWFLRPKFSPYCERPRPHGGMASNLRAMASNLLRPIAPFVAMPCPDRSVRSVLAPTCGGCNEFLFFHGVKPQVADLIVARRYDATVGERQLPTGSITGTPYPILLNSSAGLH